MRVGTIVTGPLAAIILGLLSGGAMAACPGSNQMELGECAAIESKKADAALNAVYRKLEKTPELVAAQRLWIAYRDAQTKSIVETYGHMDGTMYIPMSASEVMELTKDRALFLKSLKELISER